MDLDQIHGLSREAKRKIILERVPPVLASEMATTVCRHFKTGSCSFGDGCKLSHDLKQEWCVYHFNQGKCDKGEDCLFSHKNIPFSRRINMLRDTKLYQAEYEKKKDKPVLSYR